MRWAAGWSVPLAVVLLPQHLISEPFPTAFFLIGMAVYTGGGIWLSFRLKAAEEEARPLR